MMTLVIQKMKVNQTRIWHVLRLKVKLVIPTTMAVIQMNPQTMISIQMLVNKCKFYIHIFNKILIVFFNFFFSLLIEKEEDVADEYDSNVSTTESSEGESDDSAAREKKKKKKEKKEKKKDRREKTSSSSVCYQN